MINIKYYIIIFIIYSIFGFLFETIKCFIINKRIVNRGFLLGPYLPIYGIGAVIMTYLLTKYKYNIFLLIIYLILVFSLLEYLSSYLLEKVFKSRWWDYSKRRYNINGRICLESIILFTLFGIISIYIINPIIFNNLKNLKVDTLNTIIITFSLLFIVDSFVSFYVMFSIKRRIKKIKKDNTEEINKEMIEFLTNNKYTKKRIYKAYPNIIFK